MRTNDHRRHEACVSTGRLAVVLSILSVDMSNSKFRLQSKYVFLTYPRCQTDKGLALNRLKVRFEERLEWAVVCSERHKDGSPHLHVVCAHIKRFDAKTSSYWDFVGGQHGSYEPVRNLRSALQYVAKEGLYCEYKISVSEYLRLRLGSGGSKYAAIASRLRTGSSIADMNEENCGFVMQNLKKLQDYVGFLERSLFVLEEDKKQRKFQLTHTGAEPEISIVNWLHANIYELRNLGQRQLWIFGPTGIGKTHLKEQLIAHCRVYEPGYDSEWFDDYQDGRYDLVIFDEYKGQYKPTIMNLWLGSEYGTLRRRGRNPVLKRTRLPCVVFSNYDILGCYSNMEPESPSLVAMDRRCKLMFCDSQIQITFH